MQAPFQDCPAGAHRVFFTRFKIQRPPPPPQHSTHTLRSLRCKPLSRMRGQGGGQERTGKGFAHVRCAPSPTTTASLRNRLTPEESAAAPRAAASCPPCSTPSLKTPQPRPVRAPPGAPIRPWSINSTARSSGTPRRNQRHRHHHQSEIIGITRIQSSSSSTAAEQRDHHRHHPQQHIKMRDRSLIRRRRRRSSSSSSRRASPARTLCLPSPRPPPKASP